MAEEVMQQSTAWRIDGDFNRDFYHMIKVLRKHTDYRDMKLNVEIFGHEYIGYFYFNEKCVFPEEISYMEHYSLDKYDPLLP